MYGAPVGTNSAQGPILKPCQHVIVVLFSHDMGGQLQHLCTVMNKLKVSIRSISG